MRNKCLIIALVLLLLLSACGAQGLQQSENGIWHGAGKYYVAEECRFDNLAVSNYAFGNRRELYYVSKKADDNGKSGYYIRKNDDVIYTCDFIPQIARGDSGIWAAETIYKGAMRTDVVVHLISSSGDELLSISLGDKWKDYSQYDILFRTISSGDEAYLLMGNNSNQLCIISITDGGVIEEYKDVPAECTDLVADNENHIYAVRSTKDNNTLTPLEYGETLNLGGGLVSSGHGAISFYLSNKIGLYEVDSSGAVTPLIIWDECNIDLDTTVSLSPEENGEFYCCASYGSYFLYPGDYSKKGNKTELTMAAINPSAELTASVIQYNQQSKDYQINIVDFAEDGALSDEQAKKRFNAELTSGTTPDLISFEKLSPYTYAAKEYLDDLMPYLNNDAELPCQDIAVLKALSSRDGVYFIGNAFNAETYLGLGKTFGARHGWTVKEYLAIDAANKGDETTAYNMTRELFLQRMSQRYTRTAISWEDGTCDFDNEEFIEILNASTRIKESPEGETLDTAPGAVKLAKGTQVLSMVWLDSVQKIALEERKAGCSLSCVGWPTPDGSCGSDVYISIPAGICSKGENKDGCWDYIKYIIKNPPKSDSGLLPMYMPELKSRISKAIDSKNADKHMTQQDADKLLSLISDIRNVAIYDENVTKIISDESTGLFAGEKTAAEIAKNIQSRVSIYVSEQS